MNASKSPFPECATYDVDLDRVSLQDLSELFNGRSRSALYQDCVELGVECTHGVDRNGAWTLYVYLAWYQWMKNRGFHRVHRKRYWQDCTPDHLKGPGVECSAETASEQVREQFLTQIGKTPQDFNDSWAQLVAQKAKKYNKVTIDV